MVITFTVLLVLTSLLLILLVLLHKGRGGGLSDMFGGGVPAARWVLGRRAQPGPHHHRCRGDLVRLHRRRSVCCSRPATAAEHRTAGSPTYVPEGVTAWQVEETPSGVAGSARVRWARPSGARPPPGSGWSTSAAHARVGDHLRRRGADPGLLGLPAVRPAGEPGLREPAAAAEDRAVQDPPRLREGAALRQGGRGHPRRGDQARCGTAASAARSSSRARERGGLVDEPEGAARGRHAAAGTVARRPASVPGASARATASALLLAGGQEPDLAGCG